MAFKIRVDDGSAAQPGLAFDAEIDNGFYRIASDNIGLSLGGVKRVDFSTSIADFTTLSINAVNISGSGTVDGNALSATASIGTEGYYLAGTTPRATTGDFRGNASFSLYARNSGNTANLKLFALASDVLSVGEDSGLTSIKIGVLACNLGFFGATPVGRQNDSGALSLLTISGTGDDTDINTNFGQVEAAVNQIRTSLRNLGLMA